jgi:predicted dehydrogenase
VTETLRAGIIGCGNVAMGHAQVLSGMDEVCVAGIADPTLERRRKMQAHLKLPDESCFADYHDLLAQGVDYVVVATPQHIRREIVESCARAGVHVLSEKPIATIPRDAQAMIDAMRASNLRYGMMHNYLFYPEYRLARRLIDEGAIGKLRHVTLNFLGVPDYPGASEYKPQWRHDPVAAGGGILMDMIHAVYLSEYLMGGLIRGVSAVIDNLDHPGDLVEDFAIANYHFDTGYATINMWWGSGPGGLEISGTQGRILVFYEKYGTGPFTSLDSFTLVTARDVQQFDPRGEPSEDPFVQIHRNFLASVRAGRDPVAPAVTGLQSLQAALAAYASGATGHFVALPLDLQDPVYQQGVSGLNKLDLRQDGPLLKHGVFGLH